MGHADIQTTQKYYIRVDADIENSLSFVENI
jgi:integrase